MRKFCSRSCAATYNNKAFPKRKRNEVHLEKLNKGKNEWLKKKEENYIQQWLNGKVPGGTEWNVSVYVRRYLFSRANSACEKCGWSVRHPVTNRVPLEINHIDGDGRNHAVANLELLCLNCHGLTPNYRGLNRGKGRPYFAHYSRPKNGKPSPGFS